MSNVSAVSPRPLSPGQPNPDELKSYSCLTCRQRKIKCDRHNPCSNCIKASQQCSFLAPVRGKRKRTTAPREGLHAKLRRYEDLLKRYGAKFEPSSEHGGDSDSETVGTVSLPDAGSSDNYGSMNTTSENYGSPNNDIPEQTDSGSGSFNTRTSNSGGEFLYPGEAGIAGPTDDSDVQESLSDLFLGPTEQNHLRPITQSRDKNLAGLHPPYHVLLKLWDIYVDRIDPLMKILHLPSFWSSLTKALQNPQNTPKSLEALISAFYFVIIVSLSEDECRDLLGRPKSVLFSQQQLVVRQSLRTAGFLETSSVVTLQAFTIYLMVARSSHRNDTLFILSGVAVRLARKMDLHRDGSSLGLSSFETEMRRRLWWHIAHMDYRTADFVGAKPSMDIFSGDAKMPLNIADKDLSPDMVDLPPESKGITSMAISLLRCNVRELLFKFSSPIRDGVGGWEIRPNPEITRDTKMSLIDQLESLWEEKYLRYCDPSNTLHNLVSIMARSGISTCKIKLFAPDPRRFANRIEIPQSERDIIFTNATKILEYVNLVRGNQSLDKYLWQIGTSFLWSPFLYVLIEARHRKVGPDIDRLWQLIGAVLLKYPQMFEKHAGAVYAALGKWTLEAWDGYLEASKVEGLAEPPTPEYINAIRRCRTPPAESSSNLKDLTDSRLADGIMTRNDSYPLSDPEPFASYDFSDLLSFETDPNQWVQWESLVAGDQFSEGTM